MKGGRERKERKGGRDRGKERKEDEEMSSCIYICKVVKPLHACGKPYVTWIGSHHRNTQIFLPSFLRHMKGLGAHPIGTETTATKYVRFSNIHVHIHDKF